MDEKRVHARMHYLMGVTLELEDNQVHVLESSDISMGGISLITDTPFLKGSKGTIKILLEWGDQKLNVSSDCVVSHIDIDPTPGRPQAIGLKFANMDSKSSINLYNIIKYQNTV